jgi:hypothetical protein
MVFSLALLHHRPTCVVIGHGKNSRGQKQKTPASFLTGVWHSGDRLGLAMSPIARAARTGYFSCVVLSAVRGMSAPFEFLTN